MKNKVTAADLADIGTKIRRFGARKIGTTLAGGVFCFTFTPMATGKMSWIVVGQDAYYKFGDAQRAACYGKVGVDYFELSSAALAAKKITQLVKKA